MYDNTCVCRLSFNIILCLQLIEEAKQLQTEKEEHEKELVLQEKKREERKKLAELEAARKKVREIYFV